MSMASISRRGTTSGAPPRSPYLTVRTRHSGLPRQAETALYTLVGGCNRLFARNEVKEVEPAVLIGVVQDAVRVRHRFRSEQQILTGRGERQRARAAHGGATTTMLVLACCCGGGGGVRRGG